MPSTSTTTGSTTNASTSTNIGDVQNGPLAKAGSTLITIAEEFQQFEATGGEGTFLSSQSQLVEISGTNVGVDVRGTGDLNAFDTALANLGMQIQATNPSTGTVEGILPIGELVNVAQLPQTVSISPVYRPIMR